jgi:hypothetical protein
MSRQSKACRGLLDDGLRHRTQRIEHAVIRDTDRGCAGERLDLRLPDILIA